MKPCVKAHAKKKKDQLDDIENVSLELLEHLCKIYIFRNSDCLNHWQKEVYSFLHSIRRCKGNKKITSSDIYKYLWQEWGDRFDRVFDCAISEEDFLKPEFLDVQDARAFCEEYTVWISNELERFQLVDLTKVKVNIDRLLGKHPKHH